MVAGQAENRSRHRDRREDQDREGIVETAGQIEQRAELDEIEAERVRDLPVAEPRRTTPRALDPEIDQRRGGDDRQHRSERQREAEREAHEQDREELARDRHPADQDQRPQAHAAARPGRAQATDEAADGGVSHAGIPINDATLQHNAVCRLRMSAMLRRDWPKSGQRGNIPARMSQPAIEIHDLTKRFGPVIAVDGLSFAIGVGETVGLLGGNGAGKTTTIAMLLGLLLPTSGTHHRARRGYAEAPLPRAAADELLLALCRPAEAPDGARESRRLRAALRRAGTAGAHRRAGRRAADRASSSTVRCGTLSAGQKTRVSLAKALINKPEVLLLDEPTASLDPDTADWIRVYLEGYKRTTGATIVLASHNMSEVERLATRVMMMRAGRIVDDGAPAALLSKYGRRQSRGSVPRHRAQPRRRRAPREAAQ